MQAPGRDFKATEVSCNNTDTAVSFSLDISKAYPDSAYVKTWKRSFTYRRGKQIEINDRYTLDKALKPTRWTFMSYPEPVLKKPGTIEFKGNSKVLVYSEKLFNVTIEPLTLTDGKLSAEWGNTLYRILLTRKSKTKSETCTFIIK